MGERNNNCSNCEEENQFKSSKSDFISQTHELNNIKKVVAIVSGKGGVGKSLVTSLLAVMTRRKGYNVGVMDADITGPSKDFYQNETVGLLLFWQLQQKK